jgi:SAM-dependent methyltransferase
MQPSPDSLRATVRDTYAAVARGEALSCCGPTGCTDEVNMIGDAYDGIEGYVADADLRLGCGLPVEHAGLAPGLTVLDLGAGAGLDAFVARHVVGETGRVLGVDFTPEMVEKARANAAKLGVENVQFEHGDIEALPFADASVDVVISNCVLNLVPDKPRAFAEMARVLRPGGHFCVSDVVSRGDLPEAVRASAELYAGCVAGAIDQAEYLARLRAAGFERVEVVTERPIDLPEGLLPDGAKTPLYSVTVRGVRPDALPLSSEPDTTSEPMSTLQVYEPALCCSTGLCGPDPDEALVQFAADLKALAAEGVAVDRFNLAQEPQAFVAQPAVVAAVNTLGMSVLPLVVKDGRVVSHGRYPSKAELEALVADAPEPAEMLPLDLAPASGCCAPDSGCC